MQIIRETVICLSDCCIKGRLLILEAANQKLHHKSKLTSKMSMIYRNTVQNKHLLFLVLPVFIYYVIFHYIPMYGVVISFKKYIPGQGLFQGEWVGLKWFISFFKSFYFPRLIKNTFLLSFYGLLWGFPIPIIFALALNEVRNNTFKRTVQTISYLPHFISVVVVVGMMFNFLSPTSGIINNFIKSMGKEPISFLNDASKFRTLYISSGIWQSFGWDSIVYLASISSIDAQLYEASRIDGCNRLQQIAYVTIPGIMPTIIILLILRMGSLLSVGYEKIILMYNPATYQVADVISTYVYRRGIIGAEYSFAAAVGLFNSAVNFIFLFIVNRISKKIADISLW